MKELLSSSSFPLTNNLIVRSISNCNKRCDICPNFMVFDNTFKYTTTGKYCKVKGALPCDSVNMVYLFPVSAVSCSMLDQLLVSKEDLAYIKVIKIQVKKDVAQLNIFFNIALVRVNLITLRSSK